MLTFAGQGSEVDVIESRTEGLINNISDNRGQPKTNHVAGKMKTSVPVECCGTKVLCIRRQLADGKYDINKRLNVVLDKLLETLTS